MVTARSFVLAASLALFISSSASADEEKKDPAPTLHHSPQMTARVGEDMTIGASVDRPDHLRRAVLVWKGASGAGEVEFSRSSDSQLPYVAVIPGASVAGPDLSYAIELETTEGARVPVFASRAEPYHVTVLDSPEDAREASLLSRLEGRRSVVQASSEYVEFAPSDQYYRIEGSYTYRLLGTVAEFGIRAGIVRGESLVPGELQPSTVGLNYGAPRIRLRAADWFHVEGEFLTSVTEVGFAVGGGGAILLGDAYGSKLVLGLEGIQDFGARGYTRLDVVANKRLTISPMVEITNMPHATYAGVRLLGEAGINLGRGFRLDLRGGYQARTFTSGGPSAGGGLAYMF